MTALELLQHIGNADDKYVMESRKKPKRPPVWPRVLAAVLALAILGTGAGYLVNLAANTIGAGGGDAAAASVAAGEAPAAAPEEAPAEAAPAEAEAAPEAPGAPLAPTEEGAGDTEQDYGPVSDYAVTLLAGAKYPESIAIDDYDASSDRWKNNQISDSTANAINSFSYKTAASILSPEDDVESQESGCYSPMSLYQTLAILASGAEGETQSQILNLLGIGDLDTLAEESGKLYRCNYRDDEIEILKIANSLWLDDAAEDGTEVSYNLDWVQSVANDYYADVFTADFSDADTPKALGAWVAEQTGGMLNPTVEFAPDNVMAIVNTLWYKTQWADDFMEQNTYEDDFILSSGEPVLCDFMHQTNESGRAVLGDGYTKSFRHLYSGKMIFVLPDEGVDIETLLTEEKLTEIFENANYQDAEVQWSVPKFETNASYDLAENLQSLGITDAFDLLSADFSPMAESTAPLFLGTVRQDTRIKVTEAGIEAAAFTIAGMMVEEGVPEEKPVVEMNLNRPFLYLITANDGSTLFMGVVRNPET